MAVVLFLILSLLALLQSFGVEGGHNVSITLLESAVAKGAVCLDGSPPAYAYSPGFGEGSDNWHIYLQAGGWCANLSSDTCIQRSKGSGGSSSELMKESGGIQLFDGMLDDNSTFNPDFYNWNVFFIFYCDGSSFLSDVEEIDPVNNITYRGGRIFDAMMQELLQKGIGKAKNALLSGSSAGGLATILHCDKFRALFPKDIDSRVKCLSDSGFFIRGEHLFGVDSREARFSSVVAEHKLEKLLPTSCTEKLSPASLCLFPENFIQGVQTPLFLLESAFDKFQISYGIPFGDRTPRWKNCTDIDLKLYNSTHREFLRDFGTTFKETLKSAVTKSSTERGYFVHSCFVHTHMLRNGYSTCSSVVGHNVLAHKTVAQAIGVWFYGRSEFKEIDIHHDLPRDCSRAYHGEPNGPVLFAKCIHALHHH